MSNWKSAISIFILLAILTSFPPTATAIAETVSIQGKLTNSNGQALTGDYTFLFELFDSNSGGAALWTETHGLTVTNGIFSANMGSNNTTQYLTTADFNAERWIQISVDGTTQIPRIKLNSQPSAFIAKKTMGIDLNAFMQFTDFNSWYASKFSPTFSGDSNFTNIGISGNTFLNTGVLTITGPNGVNQGTGLAPTVLSVTGGRGGDYTDSTAVGGGFSFIAGRGGQDPDAGGFDSADGGAFVLTSGAGGRNFVGLTGAGGNFTITTGVGGATTASSNTNDGGNGGSFTLTTGIGGNAIGNVSGDGGDGGDITFNLGAGGTSASGTAGSGGTFTVTGGNANFTGDSNFVNLGISGNIYGDSSTVIQADKFKSMTGNPSGADAVAFGVNTTASGLGSFATGTVTTASGMYSTAIGEYTTASGDYSFALGRNTAAFGTIEASKDGSMAGGYIIPINGNIQSTGFGSLAFGVSDTNLFAAANGSIALGYDCIAKAEASICLGKDLTNYNANSVLVNDLNVLGTPYFDGNFSIKRETDNQVFVCGIDALGALTCN